MSATPRHDSEVAAELGYSVRYIRVVLDKTPHSHLLKGRERFLLPHHEAILIKALENQPCRLDLSGRAKGAFKPTASEERSREGALKKALELATGKRQTASSRNG